MYKKMGKVKYTDNFLKLKTNLVILMLLRHSRVSDEVLKGCLRLDSLLIQTFCSSLHQGEKQLI